MSDVIFLLNYLLKSKNEKVLNFFFTGYLTRYKRLFIINGASF